MKKIFMSMKFTNLKRDCDLISLGMITDDNISFYCEVSDFDYNKIDIYAQNNFISRLKYSNKLKDKEDPLWSWSKDNSCSIVCTQKEVGKWIFDWLQSLVGGKLSWVDYDGVEPPIIKDLSFEIWASTMIYDWAVFCDLFGNGQKLPSCLHHSRFFNIETFLELKRVDPNIDLYDFTGHDTKNKFNSLEDAIVVKETFYQLKKFR